MGFYILDNQVCGRNLMMQLNSCVKFVLVHLLSKRSICNTFFSSVCQFFYHYHKITHTFTIWTIANSVIVNHIMVYYVIVNNTLIMCTFILHLSRIHYLSITYFSYNSHHSVHPCTYFNYSFFCQVRLLIITLILFYFNLIYY